MPDPPRLDVGDLYRCPRCQQQHVVEQPYFEDSTAARQFLYVLCRGDQYFVGVSPTTRELPPQEES